MLERPKVLERREERELGTVEDPRGSHSRDESGPTAGLFDAGAPAFKQGWCVAVDSAHGSIDSDKLLGSSTTMRPVSAPDVLAMASLHTPRRWFP